MPEICRFYGIIIRMFLIGREHPSRHIHIKYGEYQAVMELENLNIIEGTLPKKCRQLVREWAELHQDELLVCGIPKNSTLLRHWSNTMKLIAFKHISAYRFLLTFDNGESKETDLQALIGNYVDLDALDTARLDVDWGCLEFNGGKVDIEPKTLYRFVSEHSETRVAA